MCWGKPSPLTPLPKVEGNSSFAKQTETSLPSYHPILIPSKKRCAFTLAEVLVTLGIIGIVAALTMPSLIQHHKKQEVSARLKKFYSTVNQAIMLSEIDNGSSSEWVKEAMAKDEEGNFLPDENRMRAVTYFERYLAPYMKYIKIDDNPQDLKNEDGRVSKIKIYMNDGTSFGFNNGMCADFTYDINGDRKPNYSGKDIFRFLLCPKKYKNSYLGSNSRSNFGPFCDANCDFSNNKKREKTLILCKKNGSYCARLLMIDGWEFKSDYPYKL